MMRGGGIKEVLHRRSNVLGRGVDERFPHVEHNQCSLKKQIAVTMACNDNSTKLHTDGFPLTAAAFDLTCLASA